MMAGLVALSGMAQAAFVTIGDAGNAADTANGGIYGDVAYTYQISATEVTIAEFQLATGAGNGDENVWSGVGPNAPAANVSLYEAMKYCNWLTTRNVNSGYYGAGGTNMSALSHDAYAAANGLTYFMPTADEWYKAAYYTGNSGDLWSLYANGTDTVPGVETDSNYGGTGGTYPGAWVVGTGTAEQNGTYDMTGNVWEWMEGVGGYGMLCGGHYRDTSTSIDSSDYGVASAFMEADIIGFRVVAIPEPATALLFGIGGFGAWLVRRNKLKSKEEMDP
jgi:formylglycine-generating enzyme